MSDDLYQWKQKGNIYLWLYKSNRKNFPGYHMSWDDEGRDSLLTLIKLLKKSPIGANRSMKLSLPTEDVLMVPNNGQDIVTKKAVKIKLCKSLPFIITEDEDRFYMDVSYSVLDEFEVKVSSVRSNCELELGAGSGGLSFWW